MSGVLGFLLGGQSVRITVSPTSYTSNPSVGAATARFELRSSGDIFGTQGNTTSSSDRGDWISPKIGMSNYWARSTNVTGAVLSTDASAGTWVQLNADRAWTRSASAGASQSTSFTLEIAGSSGGTPLFFSGTITLDANGGA